MGSKQAQVLILGAFSFWKFLKFKKDGKGFGKGKLSSFKKDKKEFEKKESKESPNSQGLTCYKCNRHGHLKKECPTYLRGKSKALATTLSDSDSSNSNSEESCDGDGNYSAFMAITSVDSNDDLKTLKEELGEHTDVETIDDGDAPKKKKIMCVNKTRSCKNPTMPCLKKVVTTIK